jgi:type VI secretion system protein VasJ
MTNEALSLLLAPVSASQPAGVDLSYDPEFERLSGEIKKQSSLASELPDWAFVATECDRTLRERSKDLRVMTWLVAAKFQREGWQGAVDGLTWLLALAREYWPIMLPPIARARARGAQLEWLWGALAKRVTSLAAHDSDAEQVRALAPLVTEIGAFFLEQLKDADPGMGALRIAVRTKISALAEPPPAVPEASPAQARPRADGSGPTEALAPVVITPREREMEVLPERSHGRGLAEAQDAARALRERLLTLAHDARRDAATSAWPYRVLRNAAWLTVEQAPEVDNGKTFLRAPKPQEHEMLARLANAESWDGLLDAAEQAVGEHPFWLDPHRYAALALERKGVPFRDARQAVMCELHAFLDRVAGVQALAFSNGTPFAMRETLEWLELEASRVSRPANVAAERGASSGSLDAWLITMNERFATAATDEALAVSMLEANRLPSARERFGARLALAQRAHTAQRGEFALALYERFLPEVTETLESWEPALAARLLGSYLKARRAFPRNFPRGGPDSYSSDAIESALFRRLLAIDPHEALRLQT